jgi:hypothetical protein
LRADLVLTALEQALWAHIGLFDCRWTNSDRGVSYLSIRYTELLAEAASPRRLAVAAIPATTLWWRRCTGSITGLTSH